VSRSGQTVWRLVLLAASVAIFAFSWLLRYNDPEGSYAGLSDDHFYYVIRGWQMLFGELPDRDYVDAGAPLAYGISAALQLLVDRGTWSEFVFCVTAVSLGVALTCIVAARASGSTLLGIVAALFAIALLPRLYNYPKIVVYPVAIAALWSWIAAPTRIRTVLVAAVTTVAFLLRHDHGLYVGGAFALLLLAARPVAARERLRHAALFGLTTLVLLAPYLAYLEVNGGVARHFSTGYEWSQRDRDRAPLELPTLRWQPLSAGEPSDAPPSEWWNHAPFMALRTYRTWWLFWLAVLLPVVSLALLAAGAGRDRPAWRDERLRIGVVIVFATLVNSGFLRGNLPIQLPDVSVPMVVLWAWTTAVGMAIVRSGRMQIGGRVITLNRAARAGIAGIALIVAIVTTALVLPSLREQIENSSLFDGIGAIRSDAAGVTERLKSEWPVGSWAAGDSRAAVQLALYVNSCTAPTDRVLVTPYLPPVVGLAERGFAGGHGDLRAGFFATDADQELTIGRLRRQSVPVVIGPPSEDMEEFVRRLPLVARYLNDEYTNLGDRELGEDVIVQLMVSRKARQVGTFAPLALPCFR
jgi:hypothetical protein